MLTLMTALFRDLSSQKDAKIPTQPELREHRLLELFKKNGKPVVLIVDDAHAIHTNTLKSLKQLMELVRDNDQTLSVILSGHPKLGNDLKRPVMEEIGGRAVTFEMKGIAGKQHEYIHWLLEECLKDGTSPDKIIEPEAVNFLSQKLATPLQIHYYLSLAIQYAFETGGQSVTREVAENVLAKDFDDPEPKLVRQGYDTKVLADMLSFRPAQIRSFLKGQLDQGRSEEIRDKMQKYGIPLF